MIKQIFLFGVAFLSIMTLSEVFIRLSNLGSVSRTEFYSDIGKGRRRNLNYVYFNEGFGIGKYNEFRYLGKSIPPEKDTNAIRVILMGDSFVESIQIFERDYFGNIAENLLSLKYPNKKIELLNFGYAGFDIGDIYAYHQNLVTKFNPDYILYMLSNGDLEPKYSDPLRPKTILENDSLKISFNFSSSKLNQFEKTKHLTQNSSILNMLNNGRKKIKKTPVLAILLDKIYYWINPTDENQNTKSKSELPISPVTIKIIESIDPKKIIFVNRDSQKLPIEFKKTCLDNGFNYWDLSEVLNSMREQGIDPNEWKITKKEGHWNQSAHKIIGKEIAKNMSTIIDSK